MAKKKVPVVTKPAPRPLVVKIGAPAVSVDQVDDGAVRTEKGTHLIAGSIADWLRPSRGPVLDPVLMRDKEKKKKKGGRPTATVVKGDESSAGTDGMPRPTRGSR